MIAEPTLDEVAAAIISLDLEEGITARLRKQWPDIHFTYCQDDDIAAAKPVRECETFNLYLVAGGEGCIALHRGERAGNRYRRGGNRRLGGVKAIMSDLQPRTKNLEEICNRVSPGAHHLSLVEAISSVLPDFPFRYRVTRAGWYRIGGIVDADHQRVATNVRQWAEMESDFDMFSLYEQYGSKGYLTTRFDGKTHYFVAAKGEGAADFVQLQVEELVEVVDHDLFIDDQIPDTIEELLDPPGATKLRHKPVTLSPPKYDFHSITDVSDLVDRQLASEGSDLRYIRFLEEWDKCSAGAKARFCDHFVLRLLPFMDRFGERKLEATPLPVKPLHMPGESVLHLEGPALSNFLHGYDRKAGYPMAWFFAMLIDKKVWPQIAMKVVAEHQDKYSYMPEKDLAVLEHWIRSPYSF
ncbi:hypothetical protein SAMN04515647_3187 [Cohaesibacter sp. ES.047]|uniref:DUF6129 family protein n=1 Tax=Cohaesibacter sp. ES.047 TaxID=1798205 RepID=UPI000BC0CD80|nr:DUF6129 family protein [Cohaesibacter sp. ES.047]SNY92923.1 hypothetical protein SAMN04515647_3187 [Cohaesibacter sp. ES.047]